MSESWYGKLAVISDIILKIYATHQVGDMANRLFEGMRMFVDFDAADLYLYNEAEENYTLCSSLQYHAKEHTTSEELGIDQSLLEKKINLVYRDSDYMTEQLENKKSHNSMYRRNQFQYGLHMLLVYEAKQVGVINLYRFMGKPDFDYDELSVCNMLKEHLALRLSSEVMAGIEIKYTVSEVVDRFGLTPRETQVLKNMLAGKDNYQISDDMMISTFTIKKHILNIYRKLEISSRTQLFKKVKEYE
ncbi:helix-turn-helix transcriptional regulator [Anaerosporobacter faecicola]|uniref:helix-turn-helix transcriptional regulator n=1 Tax=Anaerosporobacter faecicola TaxID=2718714 RepID=UPI00143C1E6B|nr:LuxR C-terminal-related transcriptional regulator [Anaerosporobacter faecicola]